MVWGKSTTLVLVCGFGLAACGPDGQAAPETDTDTDTETGTGGSTGDSAASASVSVSAGSMSAGSATTTVGESTTDTPPPADSSGGDDRPPPPETTSDSGECPFGTEGCLCDVGSMCEDGLECIDGTCVAPPACDPLDTDAHADEASAYVLEGIDCGNGIDLGVAATLFGPETDWYTYPGGEVFMCPERPAAQVATDVVADVCVYLECTSGGDVVNLVCADGSTDATSPDQRLGCCGQDGAGVAGYDCSGFGGKDVDVWISVGTAEETCSDYAMSYAM
jgi:hypothetical protein